MVVFVRFAHFVVGACRGVTLLRSLFGLFASLTLAWGNFASLVMGFYFALLVMGFYFASLVMGGHFALLVLVLVCFARYGFFVKK